MADNTTLNLGTGGDVIASDDLTTLNGGVVSGVKAQRVKAGFGVDASFRDVSGGFPLPVDTDSKRAISFLGRACAFKTPGRAAVSQKILSIHNAAGSSVLVDVNIMHVDMLSTAVKALTVVPPVIRIHRYTTVQTNGTVLTKGAINTAMTSNASVTVTGDASADTVSSVITLTITPTTLLAQAYAIRVFTAVGYEAFDMVEFFAGDTDITLRPGEGLVVFLDAAAVTTGIPATDNFIASVDWTEYTATA